ncbi:uncharacterized protein LOC125500758 [Athalia rosae]|uniref:uncharacterized protein LOC125500758 n=1 Tax=Athalia rosae TaxID=37344 RepID=UPI0020335CB7|nr:uncharacterized protein LOC125500758 [Athalia rosae]
MDPVAAARNYVTEKLGVNFDGRNSSSLDDIIRAFLDKVPFQNISTGILPADDRFPTEQTVVESGSNLKGGMNVHNNWFFKMLLEALGYKVQLVAAAVRNPPPVSPAPSPRSLGGHFAVVVSDLTQPGDLHLVDVGSGYPVFKAVPLNELPYTATDVTVTYRFIDENGQWHREHKEEDGATWTRFISYDKTLVRENPREAFRDRVKDFLKEDWLVGGIVAVRYPRRSEKAIPNIPDFDKEADYLLQFNNDALIVRSSSGFLWEKSVPVDQIPQTFGVYFPSVPLKDVQRKLEIIKEGATRI